MSGRFNIDEYVDVAARIREFYAKYPEGRLTTGSPPQIVEVGGKPFVWYHARAYRTPDDPLPGDGWASEPIPGPTQFKHDSELQNAETSAWGRAIVALGFETKHIASANEVRAREAAPAPAPTSPFQTPFANDAQIKRLWAIVNERGVPHEKFKQIVEDVTQQGSTKRIPRNLYEAVVASVQAVEVAA